MATQRCLIQKTWLAFVPISSYLLLFVELMTISVFADDLSDNARDIINFLLHFLPLDAENKYLPIHLPRVPRRETERRICSGFEYRNLVTIGHSIGGTAMYGFSAGDAFRTSDQLLIIAPEALWTILNYSQPSS
jgi:hypothetical protein